MASRIPTKPADLAAQLQQAGVGIGNEAAWPVAPSVPTAVQVGSARDVLINRAAEVGNAEGALKVLRQQLADGVEAARAIMAKIDSQTDLLYGPDGAQKANFGLTPKKTTTTTSATPEQVVITSTSDGTAPASIYVDWDSVDGAVYELQWFSDAPLTQMVGTVTVTASEFEIPGLTKGSQYWFRVRAIRSSLTGPWSDQATRVANI